MVIKGVLSATAFVVTFALFAEYIRSVRAARTVPHVFSWTVWAGGTLIVFVAQLAGGGGVGAWPIGLSGCVTAYIAYLAYRRREQSAIRPVDWVFFVLAILALPAWWLASDPLWAVVLLTVADVIGFGPSFRRAYSHPYQEHAGFFALGALRNLLVIFALERYSWTTILFPAAVGIACLALACFLYVRRIVVPRPEAHEVVRFAPEPQFRDAIRKRFTAIEHQLRAIVADAEIHHVGSTAIPGSLTKGDLDVQVRVSPQRFAAAKAALASRFAINAGGFSDRDAISFEDYGSDPPVGVHLTVVGGSSDVQLRFRDLLLASEPLRLEYDELKRRFDGGSMEAYRSAKAAFVSRVLSGIG